MNDVALKQPVTRETDPNVLQRRAASPDSSVWVGASAGSGKTKVLTDRILRLLLPDKNGLNATPPHKILALTFTKAGASEMTIRVQKTLSHWATIDDETLKETLQNLLGVAPTKTQTQTAKQLFAKVVDAPGGMQIMTLHSFCQSVLGRFPLEAGLSPSFILLEESQAQKLYGQAKQKVLKQAQEEKGSPLANALDNIATLQNADQFDHLLGNFIRERRQANALLKKYFDSDGLYNALCQELGVKAGQSIDDLIYTFSAEGNFDQNVLKQTAEALLHGTTNTDQPKGEKILKWLACSDQKEREQNYEIYKTVFLKKDGDLFKTLATKGVQKIMPDIIDVMQTEANRILDLEQKIGAVKTTAATRDLFLLGSEILNTYQNIKEEQSVLDFDDLILKTLALFKGESINTKNLSVIMPWVRFKMDQGIDHILVDEAQDTNPEQWEIIGALCDDFFDHQEEGDNTRTLFVVGDEKQSIFSFQRASPEKFQSMRDYFADKVASAQKKFDPVQFNISFRSAPAILDFVDTVFANGLSDNIVTHESFRRRQAGLVELWPLFEPSDTQERDPWSPPTEIINSTSGASQMADQIGDTIHTWIDSKTPLESYNRPITPQDILILVRSRTAFLDQLVRALKTRNIPVSGVDRMVLSEQLVVQDIMAVINFALLPDDDLNLAGLLKSPFIGWSEDQLFDAAYNRDSSLWQAVKNSDDHGTINWLSTLIEQSGRVRPYDFMAGILQNACPAAISGLIGIKQRLGDEALDPLDEFLNHALAFEKDNLPTLQNFVKSQADSTIEIKRQMEEGDSKNGVGAVRIMTVHAAKGLQAPIVILPDTIRSSSSIKNERILWPDRTGQALPYFCPTSEKQAPSIENSKERLKQLAEEEYQRLLYVALTRAESHLYIGGYKTKQKPLESNWYNLCRTAMENHPDAMTDGDIIRLTNPMIGDPDKAQKTATAETQKIETPDWLFKPMPIEPSPPRPLVPSRPSGDNVPVLSPLQSDNQKRFLRGNITHKLLQLLPDITPENRATSAKRYVAMPVHGLSDKVQDSIINETMTILNHPDFAPIFGAGSVAEASITGLINGNQMVSGQIDRLLITDEEILIIDYKTNRPPPTDPKDIPQIYINQMRSYRTVMQEIYPAHIIKTALIWTDGPDLMIVD